MTHDLSHIDPQGRARMVDVSGKPVTRRTASASASVRISPQLAQRIADNSTAKGNLLETARLAGIQAAKRTGDLIPLCHPIPLDHVDVDARLDGDRVRIHASVTCHARTGAEMEALTAAAVAALTVVDMGKAIDRAIVIEDIRVTSKSGGRSGDWSA